MKNRIIEQSFSHMGGGKSFLLKSLFFSFLMLGFFSCGKEAVVEVSNTTNYGEISNRNDDPQEGCRCFMQVIDVLIESEAERAGWGLADYTNMSPDFQGINDKWLNSANLELDLPTDIRELGGPIPGTHQFIMNWFNDEGVDVVDDFTIIFKIDCFQPNNDGVLELQTSVNHELVWANADWYLQGNNSSLSSAIFRIEFGCLDIPVRWYDGI